MSEEEKFFPTKIPFIRRKAINSLDDIHLEDEDILEEDNNEVVSDEEEQEENNHYYNFNRFALLDD